MKNVTAPRTVSFEDALRNLAAKLTGASVNALPRTQEGVVQYMAENVPGVDELAEAVTQKVIDRLKAADEPPAGGAEGPSTASGTPDADGDQDPQEPKSATEAAGAAKTGRSRKSK